MTTTTPTKRARKSAPKPETTTATARLDGTPLDAQAVFMLPKEQKENVLVYGLLAGLKMGQAFRVALEHGISNLLERYSEAEVKAARATLRRRVAAAERARAKQS